MTIPVFVVNPDGYELRSADGVLEWVAIKPHPAALFHHARPRWPDEQPIICAALPGGSCYADAGNLRGPNLTAWASQDPAVIEAAMRRMWAADDFERQEGHAA
ncbi:MAG: hypothetical protein M3N43_06930 [Actinomycetota bacterium]|nr:hypothetical protein [Actinomycetota bacterium]